MRPEYAIREACRDDATAIEERVREHVAESGGRGALDAAFLHRYLSSGRSSILLAERADRVLGLLSYSVRPDLYHAADVCLIEELIVAPPVRRQGVGRALVAELQRRLQRIPCAELSVAVDRENPEALRFYRTMGLTEEAVLLEAHAPVGSGE